MTSLQQKINNERMILLLENGKKSNISIFVVSLVIAYLFIDEVPSTYLGIWFSSIVAFIIIRSIIITKKDHCKSLNHCRFYYGLSTFIISFLVATISWLPGTTSHILNIATLVVIGAGLVSAGLVILEMDRTIQLLYILPFPVLLALRIMTLDNKEAFDLSYLVLIFIVVMSAFGKQATNALTRNLSLRFKNEQLALDMKAAKEEAIQAKKIAEKANRSKSIFLANMSHEIRTPMNAIIGLTDILNQTNLSPKQQHLTDNVKGASIHLLALLSDILDISKIEAKELTLEENPFLLHQCVQSITHKMLPLAENKGLELNVTLNFEPHIYLIGDELRLQQIMINLIDNAIKFTDNGSIEVHIQVKKQDHLALLSCGVKDTGIGIDQSKINTIFNIFKQADNSFIRKHTGNGLGLSISAHLVNLMNGTLKIESKPEQGSHFYFEIPLPYNLEDIITIDKKLNPLRKLKILVVEDDEINRFLAETLLQNEGHEVDATENGLESLQYLTQKRPDLILMDIQMPIMDGYTATQIIRTSEKRVYQGKQISHKLAHLLHDILKNQHLPIFALTAHAMVEDRKKCFEAGVDYYLTKPFEHEKIIEAINRVA